MSILASKHSILISIILLSVSECTKNYCGSNICRNTKQHTLCRFQTQEPATYCLDYEKIIKSDDDKQAILDKLNSRRNKVAAGDIKSLPAAADMLKLEWNEELELFAQRWANQCTKYSSPDLKDTCRDLDGSYVEQNIATIYGDSPGLTATTLVDVWYMELLSINGSILSRFRESKERGFNHYEYFSQLVWAESSEVGCGSVKFKDRDSGNRTVFRLICNFAPGGNQANRAVYTYGAPCSRCPQDTACDPIFKALCGKTTLHTNQNKTTDGNLSLEYETSQALPSTNMLSNTDTTTIAEVVGSESTEENYMPFEYFSHVHDFTRQLVTAISTKHDCKDIISVDHFIDLLRKRLSSDPDFKELLLSTKLPTLTGFLDSSFTDPSVAAFVSKLYSKKEPPTTIKITESDLLNSTLLVDLVEAVIFRSNGGNDKMQLTDDIEHTTQYASQVSPVKVQAELARIQKNSDFTGHYFFPEDDMDVEESSGETTESYYDTSNIPIEDIMLEIGDIKKSTVTIDFLDEIFETEPVTDSTISVIQLSPDDMNVYKNGHNVMKKFLEDITDKTPTNSMA